MQGKKIMTALGITLISTSPAWAVYKCKDATGRTVFQERACEHTGTSGKRIEVRPAAGQPAPPPVSNPEGVERTTASPQPQSEAEKIRSKGDKLRKENRLHALNNFGIPGAQFRIRSASNRCEENMLATRSQESDASNNLVGGASEQSISTAMQAIAARCSTEQTRLNSDLERLLSEKTQLEQELQQQ